MAAVVGDRTGDLLRPQRDNRDMPQRLVGELHIVAPRVLPRQPECAPSAGGGPKSMQSSYLIVCACAVQRGSGAQVATLPRQACCRDNVISRPSVSIERVVDTCEDKYEHLSYVSTPALHIWEEEHVSAS